ncbi:MAG: hypothetical protein ACK5JT_16130 [Hyphomicrobiaceae bacterium]
MMAGRLNGTGRSNDDGKIASLDDARRRATERAKAEKRAERDARRGGAMRPRDWIIGGIVVLMALAMIWNWLAPMVLATGGTK